MATQTKRAPTRSRAAHSKASLGTPRGRQIIADLKGVADVLRRGEDLTTRYTVRTVTMPDEPSEYDAAAVRATRDRFGVSQAVFAKLLGVSAALVRSVEQGQRTPAPVLRRLLDEFNRSPDHWRGMLTQRI